MKRHERRTDQANRENKVRDVKLMHSSFCSESRAVQKRERERERERERDIQQL